jgi:hypothetical protein
VFGPIYENSLEKSWTIPHRDQVKGQQIYEVNLGIILIGDWGEKETLNIQFND